MRRPAAGDDDTLQITPRQQLPVVGVAVGTVALFFRKAFDLPVDAILIHITDGGDVHVLHFRYQVGEACAATAKADTSKLDLIHLPSRGVETLRQDR